MFQDDRMMSILSGVVLMVAIGTVVQKSDTLKDWFAGEQAGAGAAPALLADEAVTAPGSLAFIDVLANDRALEEGATARLVVTARPGCGQVFVQNGAIQYLAEEGCAGVQSFAYGLRGSALAPAEVRVTVEGEGDRPKVASAPAPEVSNAAASAVPEAGMTLAAGPETAAPPAPRESAGLDSSDAAGASARGSEGAAIAKAVPGPLADASEPAGRRSAGAPLPDAPAEARMPEALAEGMAAEAAEGPAGTGPAVDQRPSAAAPAALPAPAVAEIGTASLPGGLVPSRDVVSLDPPTAPTGGDAHGVEAPAPASPVAKAAEPGGYPAAAGQTVAEAAGGVPEAPRPADAAVPAAPAAPAEASVAEAARATAAPAPLPRPRAARTELAGAPDAAGDAPVAPTRRDADPLSNDALADADPARVEPPAALAAAATDEEPALAAAGGLASAGSAAQPTPQALDETPTLSFSLALLEVPEASAEPAAGASGKREPSPGEARVERAELPRIGSGEEGRVALAEPDAGLGPVRALGRPLTLMPVERTEPPALDRPKVPEATSEAETQAQPAEDTAQEAEVAALTPADAPCAVPPEARVLAGRAAITTVHVVSPCHAGQAAVLEMGELSLGIALDGDGKGEIEVPGFQSRAEAEIAFEDGEALSLTLPFEEVGRIERVALVWDVPVSLELHAIEFGADPGSETHVRPDNPRSFGDVRRSGGGFLQEFAPVDGNGRYVRVYTYYLRAGGPSGIVRMMVDFASRRAGEAGTCGDGELASPGFTVLRSSRGMEERPSRSRLAALECGTDAESAGEMIDNAVGNLVIAG